ncbi:hypothetical protein BGZ73_003753 [Actinomortierella ambigua]|nr:hypothetical protein BGZ73_003753 [Actinomortierella ambigua]
MESVLSSSESFAKALKGPQTSQADKIALARQAWERSNVVLPHKQEFILEWLCTVLVRSATPTSKDTTAMALIDVEYWKLLKDILATVSLQSRQLKRLGYTTAGRTGSAQRMNGNAGVMLSAAAGAAVSGHTLVDFQAPTILLRVPVIPMFTALIQRLTLSPSAVVENDSTPSKPRGKGKKASGGGEAKKPAASPADQRPRPSTAVLELANACFGLLLSNSMAEWFQPTLEQYTPLVHAALAILTDMFPEPSSPQSHAPSTTQTHDYSSEDKAILLSFAGFTLDHFRRLMVIQANQKKVFGLIAGKMLDALIGARFSIQPIMDQQDASGETTTTTAQMQQHGQVCLDSIGAILRHGLFHQDHLQEYTTSLSIAASSSSAGGNESEKAMQSYQKQLFDQLKSMLKSDHPVAALDILPTLLVYFIEESRRRQRALASGGLDRSSGMDSARTTEFKFFTELYTLAKSELPEISSMSNNDSSVRRAVHVLGSLNRLLGAVADLQMYQSSNDNISKAQYAYLDTCFSTMSKYLAEADHLKDIPLQTVALQGLVKLAQLDDLILEAHLAQFWPTLLLPLSDDGAHGQGQGLHATAQELAGVLLETHGKSRQLGNYMSSLLKALRPFLSSPEQLASSPVLSRGFLDRIPAIVRLHLPLAQAPFIMEEFVSELKSHIMPSSAVMMEQEDENNHKKSAKKRKLNSGKGDGSDNNSIHDPANVRSAGMVVALLVHFLKGLRITSTHQKQILAHFSTLFTDFISPVLQQTNACKSLDLPQQFQERLLAPALQLHYALCKAATQYWEQALSTETLVQLTTTMTKACSSSSSKTKGQRGWIVEDSITLLLNRVVLQHVHLCLCSPQIVMDETLTKTCQGLVEFTMTTCRLRELATSQETKDGRGDVTRSAGVTAQWDGLLSTAKGPRFLVASWQTQVNDWLDIVCRFGSDEAMALLADVITDNVFSSSSSSSSSSVAGSAGTSHASGDMLTVQSLNQLLLRSANMYEVARFRSVLVDAVLGKLMALLCGPFQVGGAGDGKHNKEQDLMTMVESMLKQQRSSAPSYQEVVKVFVQWLSKELASSNSINKRSKSVSKKGPSVPQDQLLSLLSILHLLPIEYFDKRERDCLFVMMGILDHSIQKHMQADAAGLRSLLLCRKVSLAMMRWRNDAGLLASDPIIAQGLLAYVPWQGSSSSSSSQEKRSDGMIQDTQGVGKALWKTTSLMIQSLIHHSVLLATGSSLSDHAGQQLIALLELLQSWVEDATTIDQAETTVDEALSVSRIRLCILSQACQAFVQSLEQLVSTLAKKKKKAAATSGTTASAGRAHTEYDQRVEKASMLAGRIQRLMRQVETKTLSHLSKTVFAASGISLDKDDDPRMAMEVDGEDEEGSNLLRSCQSCLDHFELLRTLLGFSALVKRSDAMQFALWEVAEPQAKGSKGSSTKRKSVVTVDSPVFLQRLFLLADRLTTTLDHSKKAKPEVASNSSTLVQNMLHLVSTLTAYTCEYLPTAGSLSSLDQSQKEEVLSLSKDQVQGLITLILRVSELGTISQEDMTMLKDAYLAMMGHLSGDMFEKTLEYLLENQTYSHDHDAGVDGEKSPEDKLILVKLLEVTFLGSHQSQKRKVRKHISKLVTRMIRILQTSESVEMVVEVLGLLAGLCSELDFDLRPWEIGLVLEAITTLMSPATPLLVGTMITASSFSSEVAGAVQGQPQSEATTVLPPCFTTKDAVRVFSGVYRVLTHIARFRQEALVELIPVFTAVLQAIFHGFKSIHPSIARKQQGMQSLMASQNPFPLLTHRCLASHSTLSVSTQTIEEPLPVECAESFARLLTLLGTKAVMANAGGGAGHPMELEPPTTTNPDGTAGTMAQSHQQQHHHSHRGRQQPLDTSKAFSKHAPYLLTEYFKIQSSVVASISLLPLRQALLPGLYALMDLCSEWERELMMANLDATGKSLLKSLYSDYLKYHKYTGR